MAWYKLKNKKATIFWDPVSKLKLTAATDGTKDGWVPDVVEYNGKRTKSISAALKGGAIEIVEAPSKEDLSAQKQFQAGKGEAPVQPKDLEEEPEEEEKEPVIDTTLPLEEMNKATLQAYYAETYEVTAKDIKAFNKLSAEDALAKLKELEKE